MRLFFTKTQIRRLFVRFKPTAQKSEKIAFFCKQQVLDRFRTAGASSGTPWPTPKWVKSIGADDGRALLTGSTGYLLKSFVSYAPDANTAIVSSDARGAKTHQLGTVGKGGVLPDIVPRKAKALFIPLTDRARNSVVLSSSQLPRVQTDAYGRKSLASGPTRYGVKMRKQEGTKMQAQIFVDLVPGRIKDGVLQKKTKDGEWVDGKPDFIFLRSVSIPPRPMLPTAQVERAAQIRFITDTILNRNP